MSCDPHVCIQYSGRELTEALQNNGSIPSFLELTVRFGWCSDLLAACATL